MAWKVMVTARAFWVSGQAAVRDLEEAGCQVAQSPRAGPLPEQALIELLPGYDAVIASSEPYGKDLFQACPQLKIVARCGVGFNTVDLAAATGAGVVVTNTPGAMTDAVADYTFGLILAVARKIPEGAALMNSGGWGAYPGVLVCGKTLGLVGLGQIGQGVARRASGFGMRVLAYDPPLQAAARDGTAAGLPAVEFVDLDALLGDSDFVSLHAPAMPGTRGMLNEACFSRMKRTSYLINTARGALVDEPALITALEGEQIAGAAIDVFTQEPLPADHPLRKAPRLLLTPHSAFNAVESVETMSRLSAACVLQLMKGQQPASVCNPEVWESAARRGRGEGVMG